MSEGPKNFIITLTGPSGCGKSYVIERIMDLEQKFALQNIDFHPVRVPKYVTRPLRSNEIRDLLEGKELDVISLEHISDTCELKYQTYGKKYGLELNTVTSHLEEGKSPVIVINDIRVVEELKKKFPEQVLSLFLFREVPRRDTFLKEAKARGNVAKSETEERFNKATAIYRTYIENIGLFNRVILNPSRTPDSEDYAQVQIENVIKGVLNGKITLKTKRNGRPKLFIIAGNAASGKDEIIQAVNDMGKLQATIIPKYTSRMQDKDDGSEMICQYVPAKEKMCMYKDAYESELAELQVLFKQREAVAGKDIEKLAAARAENLKEKRAIPNAEARFWLALQQEKEKIRENLRTRILKEAIAEHRLENLRLFDQDFNQLCEIYKKEGYHKPGCDVEAYLSSHPDIDAEAIINLIEEEADVENDICFEKINGLNEKRLWDLYAKEGYHSANISVEALKQESAQRIMDEFFEQNSAYLDLEKISKDLKDEISVKTAGQIFKVTGPAYYIEFSGQGLVMYENNKTLYGFQVCELPEQRNLQYEQMLKQNKHCVLVASLIDIFNICRPFFNMDVITVFSYSEISSEEFEKKSTAGTVDRKMENFEKEIKKYSEYIADFDHVTIYAESELDKQSGGRTEELIDQIFRLFRYYNPSDDNQKIPV